MVASLIRRVKQSTLETLVTIRHDRSGCAMARLNDAVTVSGFFDSGFGIGRAADLTAAQLEQCGFRVYRHDVRDLLSGRSWFSKQVPGERNGWWVVHLNPPEMMAMFARLDPAEIPSGLRIGYWAWELETAPSEWALAQGLVDVIWAPSEFTRRAFELFKRPTRTMAYALVSECRSMSQHARDQSPATLFCQLDGNSSLDRKNVEGALQGFKLARKERGDIRFVLKTQNISPNQRSRIARAIDGDEDVRWVDTYLEEAEYMSLISEARCVVSAHRSEGFGLSLAEGALRGSTPVATGWSGNLQFMKAAPRLLADYDLEPIAPQAEVYGQYASPSARWASVQPNALATAIIDALDTDPQEACAPVVAALNAEVAPWRQLEPGCGIEVAAGA